MKVICFDGRPARPVLARLPGLLAGLLEVAAVAAMAAAAPAAVARDDAADPGPAVPALPAVVVPGHYDNAVGSSDAASEGRVNAGLIRSRPTLRPAEVLEFVPGMIVSQHSGEGKANQYYLRGFNLDHGTDFATFVDGMPVNMPTHAHGQGYSDLNFLIPELISDIHYRKGLYAAEDGDFSSAGSARISLINTLPKALGSVTLGERGHLRTLAAGSAALRTGGLLYAAELAHNDGPWEQPQDFRRFNGLLRYSLSDGPWRHSLTAMAYAAEWSSTDQVPQRALDAGLIGRFGAVDASDGGRTRRASLSWMGARSTDDGLWQANAYAIGSRLKLFSNFTYFLENPAEGDQFEQSEDRLVLGAGLARTWEGRLAGRESRSTLGLQLRHDRLRPVGLYTAAGGKRTGVTQESRVRETALGLHASNELRWTPWLRSVLGLRADRVAVEVDSSIEANGGRRGAWINSPKLSLVFGPWARTEFFANTGYGFHSNDGRGWTAHVTAKGGEPIDPAVPLVRTRGSELGLRGEWLPGLQTSVALWQLRLGSELVFVGDAGETEASGASRRRGIEINNHYVISPALMLDADVAVSRARFDEAQGEDPTMGREVPGAVRTVVSLGATLNEWGPWFGHLQMRYFGPRPLIEDGSVRSKGTALAYARVGYRFSADTSVMLDAFNLFDRRASDIDYYYASRLPGEPAEGVADLHSHPAEPRTLRLTLALRF